MKIPEPHYLFSQTLTRLRIASDVLFQVDSCDCLTPAEFEELKATRAFLQRTIDRMYRDMDSAKQ